jgi:hypothetical protein
VRSALYIGLGSMGVGSITFTHAPISLEERAQTMLTRGICVTTDVGQKGLKSADVIIPGVNEIKINTIWREFGNRYPNMDLGGSGGDGRVIKAVSLGGGVFLPLNGNWYLVGATYGYNGYGNPGMGLMWDHDSDGAPYARNEMASRLANRYSRFLHPTAGPSIQVTYADVVADDGTAISMGCIHPGMEIIDYVRGDTYVITEVAIDPVATTTTITARPLI